MDPNKFWDFLEVMSYVFVSVCYILFIGSILAFGPHLAHAIIVGGLMAAWLLTYVIDNIETWMGVSKEEKNE